MSGGAQPEGIHPRGNIINDDPIELVHPLLPTRHDVNLVIHPVRALASVLDSQRTFETRYTTVDRPGIIRRLGLHVGIEENLPSTLNVLCMDEMGQGERLDLPEGINRRLLKYLIEGPPAVPSRFDCPAFVHYLHELEYTPGVVRGKDWEIRDFTSEQELIVGEGVVLGLKTDPELSGSPSGFTPFKGTTHWSVYLGGDLYLSKLGVGPVIVATLPNMLLGFGGDGVWVLQPKGRARLST